MDDHGHPWTRMDKFHKRPRMSMEVQGCPKTAQVFQPEATICLKREGDDGIHLL